MWLDLTWLGWEAVRTFLFELKPAEVNWARITSCMQKTGESAESPEHFQNRIATEVTEGLEGTVCHIDDVLVWGKTREEHDARLHAVLRKMQKAGMTLNVEKCELSKRTVHFLGHIISADLCILVPTQWKHQPLGTEPSNLSELQNFLGMVNQLGKLIFSWEQSTLNSSSSPDVHEKIEKKNGTNTRSNSYDLKQHVCYICKTAEMAVWLRKKKKPVAEIAHLWKKPSSTTKKIPRQNRLAFRYTEFSHRRRSVLSSARPLAHVCDCVCVLKEL